MTLRNLLSTKRLFIIAALLVPNNVSAFVSPVPLVLAASAVSSHPRLPPRATKRMAIQLSPDDLSDKMKDNTSGAVRPSSLIAAVTLLTTALPAEAAAGAVPSALWAYGHYVAIIVIFGCLTAERTLVKAGMSVEDENTVVKLDVVYGVMAALLIISGFARATDFGKGSDFYLHESLFWVKMTFSGIWGGLSLFPSLSFYRRSFARKTETVPPVSEKLAARLRQVINAEISAVLSIPLLATLMARGVWYSQDFPWPAGLAVAILATGGSFYFYGNQALTWKEEDDDVAAAVKEE